MLLEQVKKNKFFTLTPPTSCVEQNQPSYNLLNYTLTTSHIYIYIYTQICTRKDRFKIRHTLFIPSGKWGGFCSTLEWNWNCAEIKASHQLPALFLLMVASLPSSGLHSSYHFLSRLWFIVLPFVSIFPSHSLSSTPMSLAPLTLWSSR